MFWFLLAAAKVDLGPSVFTADTAFPTGYFSSYYNLPTGTATQVQPVVTDSVLNKTFPQWLTDPWSVPENDTVDPLFYPPAEVNLTATEQEALYANVSATIQDIVAGSLSNCIKCIESVVQGQRLAKGAPEYVPTLLVDLCKKYKFTTDLGCSTYGGYAEGPFLAQVLSYGNMAGADGQYVCQNFISKSQCTRPALPKFDSSFYWNTTKPAKQVHKSSGKRVKVLHISDFHIDPRYVTGSESNCTSGLCCRANNPTAALYPNYTVSVPAPHFGSFNCDTPFALGAAAVEAIPVLTGTQESGFEMTVFTGDIASHDPYYELSQDYVQYAETVALDMFKKTLNPNSPLYSAIGNHDSYAQAFDAPQGLPGMLSKQFSWNYDHLSKLWEKAGWIDGETAAEARAHYGGYSVMHADNLKIITLNTDLWYRANAFAYINSTHPDNFGFLRFLASELQDCEDNGHRAWIVGHVLSGWDGTNGLPGPTDQFYQIVDRYSSTIAALFFGHTHEDQHNIYYANNATNASAATAQNVAWIGPSVVPLTNLNSGFHMYEVDSETWEIIDAHAWNANVSTFSTLEGRGPEYRYSYSVREAYGKNISWGVDEPLNATWWHLVTEQMEEDSSLVTDYNFHQSKQSIQTPNCTSAACVEAKICYMRSGSSAIGLDCKQGYGSTQSSY